MDVNTLLEGPRSGRVGRRPLDSIRGVDASWFPLAACRGMRTSLFFPGPGGSLKEVKEICSRCSVIEECRDYADVTQTEWGIWGGQARVRLTARERRALANGVAA